MVPTCFCPWTLNLHIAIVLLRLRVHYSVEIKRYKSQIRIRMIFFSVKLKIHIGVTFVIKPLKALNTYFGFAQRLKSFGMRLSVCLIIVNCLKIS